MHPIAAYHIEFLFAAITATTITISSLALPHHPPLNLLVALARGADFVDGPAFFPKERNQKANQLQKSGNLN
jgi:hypothetical protein